MAEPDFKGALRAVRQFRYEGADDALDRSSLTAIEAALDAAVLRQEAREAVERGEAVLVEGAVAVDSAGEWATAAWSGLSPLDSITEALMTLNTEDCSYRVSSFALVAQRPVLVADTTVLSVETQETADG